MHDHVCVCVCVFGPFTGGSRPRTERGRALVERTLRTVISLAIIPEANGLPKDTFVSLSHTSLHH